MKKTPPPFHQGSRITLLVFGLSILGLLIPGYEAKTVQAQNPLVSKMNSQSWIEFDLPITIRIGEMERLEISLFLDEDFLTNTIQNDLENLSPQEDYYLNFETFLDLPGVAIQPTARMSANLAPGNQHLFLYQLSAIQKGSYSGTIWMKMYAIPHSQPNTVHEYLVLSKPITLQVSPVWIFPFTISRWLGWIGLLGTVFMLRITWHKQGKSPTIK